MTDTTAPQWSTARNAGTWVGSATTELRSRRFTFRSSEPVSEGGLDDAPNPMELLVGSINGCVSVVVEIVAAELGLEVRSIETASAGTLDLRGIQGVEGAFAGFQRITVDVKVGVDATDEQFDELRAQVGRRCPALTLLGQTDAEIAETWTRV